MADHQEQSPGFAKFRIAVQPLIDALGRGEITKRDVLVALGRKFPKMTPKQAADFMDRIIRDLDRQIDRAPLELAARKAASDFLVKSGYLNLEAARQDLELEINDLWARILSDAGLPEAEMPVFLGDDIY